jgi:cytochrome c556
MRSLILLLIGIAVGAVCTAYAVNALNRRSAYSDGVMTVMGHQMKSLGQNLKQNRCTPSDLTTQLQTLRLLANDIEPAFDSMKGDAQFGRYASGLRAAADTALVAPLTTCAVATTAIGKVDQACDSCHRDYRN